MDLSPESNLGSASVPVLVVDVNGDGRSDLIVGQAHNYGLSWWEQKVDEKGMRSWVEHPIDPRNAQYHDLIWADIDGDGQEELVTGKRYRAHCGNDPGEWDDVGIYYFKWNGESFTKQFIDYGPIRTGTGRGIMFAVADLRGTGRLDVVAPGKDGLYVFFNEGSGVLSSSTLRRTFVGWDHSSISTANLLIVGQIVPNPHWSMSSHQHRYWEFIYFREGCGHIELPNEAFRAREYHLVIYPPGLPHAEYADPHDPQDTIFLGVEMAEVQHDGPLLLPDSGGELLWLCERIMDEHTEYGVSPVAISYLQAFLHIVDRLRNSPAALQLDPIDIVLGQIHRNYGQNLDLGVLAVTACMSKAHLIKQFKARVGQSPMRYLRDVRIGAAKRLLSTSSMSITEIALSTGFQDPLYFSRLFRKTVGSSPTLFRKGSKPITGRDG